MSMANNRVKKRDKDGEAIEWHDRIPDIKDFGPGKTKQSFKDSTDVNKIVAKAARTGSLSHLQKYEGVYGDFSDFDFMEAQNQLARGKQIFEELPAEIRREFGQNPGAFFEFVNNADNKDTEKMKRIFGELAKPGDQMPDVQGRGAAASEPVASENTATQGTPTVASNTPS